MVLSCLLLMGGHCKSEDRADARQVSRVEKVNGIQRLLIDGTPTLLA